MELEEAIKNIKRDIATPLSCGECTICNIEDLEILLNHITKQEQMIDEMIKVMSDRNICKYFIENYCKYYAGENKKTCDVCIKQYFEKKVEENKYIVGE